ncbi:MAG: methyltransferase domain-containing protein [Pseudomonadota bacterium]
MTSNVGDIIEAANAAWTFGDGVSERFDEHVARSVPLYARSHALITALSDYFVGAGSRCYDLGCATGALCSALAARNAGKRDVRIIGIDSEGEMIARARERCAETPSIELIEGDLLDVPLEPADMIVACYTMQFVRPRWRQVIFDAVYQSLNWGGAFVLFEKVRAPDARFQDIASGLYADYKLEQGYDGDEILAKSRSLKGVLEPFSTAGNLGLLERAGFVDVMTVMKYVCFEGFLAIK